MSLTWSQRKTRLATLLKSQGDENADGLALDRLLHGHRVIGKTARTTELENLRFQDKDLKVVGTLEYGQYGVIDVVTCIHDNRNYVRKTTDKKFALRTRDQCSPQAERDILLQARESDSPWAPHLLCAFQSLTHLSLIMDYAEGGNLWDVLESSPLEGRISESDVKWWAPQIVSAIHWCHSQGFVHRDIKPHNFVLKPDGHILLIDFGSAAPLLPPEPDGSQRVPRRLCLVPCGTCDYVSPEILNAHEEALVALEMADDDDDELQDDSRARYGTDGYGLEIDWWSLGAMLYEMVYGIAPFFANDIRQTYLRIIDHRRCLRFNQEVPVSEECQSLLQGLLTDAENRLGRRSVMELTTHPFFEDVSWGTLAEQLPPVDLHIPQFIYNDNSNNDNIGGGHGLPEPEQSFSRGFAFSALFNSSKGTNSLASSLLQSATCSPQRQPQQPQLLSQPHSQSVSSSHSSLSQLHEQDDQNDLTSPFIGFSWGPTLKAFETDTELDNSEAMYHQEHFVKNQHGRNTFSPSEISINPFNPTTPRNALHLRSFHFTPKPLLHLPSFGSVTQFGMTPGFGGSTGNTDAFSTPMRPTSLIPNGTVPRAVTSTVGRTAGKGRRTVSDREAMKQLVDCVGMSARKKVLESGRKPKILDSLVKVRSAMKYGNGGNRISGGNGPGTLNAGSGGTNTSIGGTGMTRKELRFLADPIPVPDWTSTSSQVRFDSSASKSVSFSVSSSQTDDTRTSGGQSYALTGQAGDGEQYSDMISDTSSSSAPPSPSPSPRPGSALSMMSRRSATPTFTSTFSRRLPMVGGGNTTRAPSQGPMPTSRLGVFTNTNGNGEAVGVRHEHEMDDESGDYEDTSDQTDTLSVVVKVEEVSGFVPLVPIQEPEPGTDPPPRSPRVNQHPQLNRRHREDLSRDLVNHQRQPREVERDRVRAVSAPTPSSSRHPPFPTSPDAVARPTSRKGEVITLDAMEERFGILMADITNVEEKFSRARRRFR